jgi:hypothetical protein
MAADNEEVKMTIVSINGYKLHEIQMLLEPYSKNTSSYLRYPEHRIEGTLKRGKLFIKLPVFLCVELYRRAILPQDPAERISICLDGQNLGQCVIVDFRYPNWNQERELVTLTLQRVRKSYAQGSSVHS